MALIKCKECGKEMSSEAKACPSCGSPPPKGTSRLTIFVGGLFAIGVAYAVLHDEPKSSGGPGAFTGAAPAAPQAARQKQWEYRDQADRMTGKTVKYATITSNNSMDLQFPYKGSNFATLQVRTSAKNGADVIFRFERGQTMCRSYEYSCEITVRFDDRPPVKFMGIGPSDSSTETAFLNQTQRFISEAKKAQRIKVSMQVYQNGNQVLEFGPAAPLVWATK